MLPSRQQVVGHRLHCYRCVTHRLEELLGDRRTFSFRLATSVTDKPQVSSNRPELSKAASSTAIHRRTRAIRNTLSAFQKSRL
jgi:hypothetical protein